MSTTTYVFMENCRKLSHNYHRILLLNSSGTPSKFLKFNHEHTHNLALVDPDHSNNRQLSQHTVHEFHRSQLHS